MEYPNGGKVYLLRSIDYYNIDENNDALVEMNNALKIDECAINYYFRCLIYYRLGQFENALKDINEVIKQKPDRLNHLIMAYMTRGEIYEIQGNFEKAMDDYEYVMNNANDNYFDKKCKYEKIINLSNKMNKL